MTALTGASMSPLQRLVSYFRVYAKMAILTLVGRPYKLSLLLSGGCNLRCQICSIWKHAKTTLSGEDVRQIWAAFPIKPCWVNLSGGEPTLNHELEAILGFFVALERPLLITLTTNGYVDCSPLVERVLRNNRRCIVYVSVSIDGEETEHNHARGRSGSFARAFRTYRNLRALQTESAALKVGVSTTISRINQHSILLFVRRLFRDNCTVTVNLAQVSAYYSNASADSFRRLPVRELVTLLRSIEYLLPKLSLDSFLKIIFLEGVIRHLQGKYTPVPCTSIGSNVLVTSELDLVNCTVLFQPWAPKGASRSVKMQVLEQSIREPKRRLQSLRDQVRTSSCERRCHTPCEGYVHTISALFDPRRAPGLVWIYLRVCFESLRRRGAARRADAVRGSSPEYCLKRQPNEPGGAAT